MAPGVTALCSCGHVAIISDALCTTPLGPSRTETASLRGFRISPLTDQVAESASGAHKLPRSCWRVASVLTSSCLVAIGGLALEVDREEHRHAKYLGRRGTSMASRVPRAIYWRCRCGCKIDRVDRAQDGRALVQQLQLGWRERLEQHIEARARRTCARAVRGVDGWRTCGSARHDDVSKTYRALCMRLAWRADSPSQGRII